MNVKNILYGALIALSLGVSSSTYAQIGGSYGGGGGGLIVPMPGATDPCSNVDKKASQDSSCIGSTVAANQDKLVTTSGTASGTTTTVSKITPFSVSGVSCTTPWGTTVADGESVSAFNTNSGSYKYSTREWYTDCQEENRFCVNGTLSGSYTNQSCDLQPVNGQCGSANGQYYTYPTTGPAPGTLCNPDYTYGGIEPTDDSAPTVAANSPVSLNTSTNRYSWTCSGELGGSTASCQAYRRINGQCGSSINSCSLGSTANTSSSNNMYPNYACNCTTNTSGVTTCTASATGTQTCTGGYKDTTYNWQCMGVNTGTTASCSTTGYDAGQNTTPPPPCGATSVNDTQSCATGYSGTRSRTNTVDSCTNTVLVYGTWDTSGCTACVNNATGTESAACDAGYTGTKSRTKYTNSCTGVVSYGAWNTSGCTVACTNDPTGTESAACDAGYTGTKSRTKYTNSCTGVVSYGTWNTSSCTLSKPTASGSFDKTTVTTSGSSVFSWSTSGATVSTNVDCWGTAVGQYRGSAASGSITVTFSGTGTGACNVAAINAAGQTDGTDTIEVTATCSNNATGTESAACDAGYTGTKSRTIYTNSCTGAVSYGSWNTGGCTLSKPTASGSFNKSTVAANGSATFSWSTSGATVSTNVDCWNVAVGSYRGSAASGSITVTFTGAGTGACNVAAINAAGQTDGTDTIDVTAATCSNNATGTDSAACDAGYTGTKSRTIYTNSCTGAVSYGTWNTSGCTACVNNATGTESAACDAGYTGTKSRTKYTNSCTGVVSYSSWNTSGCTAASPPTASGSFNKSTVASNGSATFSWTTSGATVSTNVDCWGAAVGSYRGLRASGSITVTFSGTGTGACNVAAINAAGQADGTATIDVTAPVVVAKPSVSGSFDTSNGAGSDFVTYDCNMDAYPGSCQVYFDWSTSGGTSTSVSCSGSWGSKSSSSASGRLTFSAGSTGSQSCSVSSTNSAGTSSASYSARGGG